MAISCDARGNVLGRADTNLVVNTRMYQVEFSGGKLLNESPTSLLSQHTLSMMQMGMSIYS